METTTPQTKYTPRKPKKTWNEKNGLKLALIFIVAIWIVNLIIALLGVSGFKPNELGDSFGMVNALFSGIAFAFLVDSILMQREELQLQREELQMLREENEKQTKEFQNHTKELEENRKQAQLSIFSQGLSERINVFETFKLNATESLSRHQDKMPFRTFTHEYCSFIEAYLEKENMIEADLEKWLNSANPRTFLQNLDGQFKTIIFNHIKSRYPLNFIDGAHDFLTLVWELIYYNHTLEDKLYDYFQAYRNTLDLYVRHIYKICVYIENSPLQNEEEKTAHIEELFCSLSKHELNCLLYILIGINAPVSKPVDDKVFGVILRALSRLDDYSDLNFDSALTFFDDAEFAITELLKPERDIKKMEYRLAQLSEQYLAHPAVLGLRSKTIDGVKCIIIRVNEQAEILPSFPETYKGYPVIIEKGQPAVPQTTI